MMREQQMSYGIGARSVVWVALGASLWVGCAGPVSQEEASPGCGEAEERQFEGERYCIYQMPIIETRFDCPSFASHAHQVGGVGVCAPGEVLPEGFGAWLDEQLVSAGDPPVEPEEDPVVPPEQMMPPVVQPPPQTCGEGIGEGCDEVLTPPTGQHRYSAQGVATRLAELLWGDVPDAALTQAAATGMLDTRSGLRAEAERMMQDARFTQRLDAFWVSYLGIDAVSQGMIDTQHPLYSPTLAEAMMRSTLTTIEALTLQDGEDVRDVWTSQEVYLDAQLAPLYGFDPSAFGTDLSRVTVAERQGVLSHPALLSTTGEHEVPIASRGVQVASMLCVEVPPIPADVVALLPPEESATWTWRERYDEHVSQPQCTACHGLFDYNGQALHGFDTLGGVAPMDQGAPRDTSGTYRLDASGGQLVSFADYAGYVQVLRGDERLPSCLTRKLYAHLGRGVSALDSEGAATRAVSYFGQQDRFVMEELVLELVSSDAFLYRP